MSQAAALPALATETYIVDALGLAGWGGPPPPPGGNGIDLAMTLVSLWLTGALLMLLVFWRRAVGALSARFKLIAETWRMTGRASTAWDFLNGYRCVHRPPLARGGGPPPPRSLSAAFPQG